MLSLVLAAGVLTGAPSSSPQAAAQPALADVFKSFCTATAPNHPACKDPASPATATLEWLLVADACDHDHGADGYCASFNAIRKATEPCLVAYNHRDGKWRPKFAMEKDQRREWAYDTDVDGTPIVTASRSDECGVMVEETTPLLYAVQLGKIEAKDNDLASGLKDLASLIGATAAAAAPFIQPSPQLRIYDRRQFARDFDEFKARQTDPFDLLAGEALALGYDLMAIADLQSDVASALNVAESTELGTLSPVAWSSVPLDVASWRGRFADLREARQTAMASLAGRPPTEAQQKVLDQAQKVIDRQSETAKAVAGLAAVKSRWDQYVVGNRMLTWTVVPLLAQPVRWTKDLSYAFTIAPDSPFASQIVTRRPKVDTSVRFTSPRASMFGVDAALIVTPHLSEATYKAVADASGQKRITATDSTSRTGQIAVFFDWRVVQSWYGRSSAWPVRPALQAGVALDTKTPGVFFGAGVDVTKWLRVSAGATWQSLKVLDGQQPDAIVGSDNEIRTKTVFRRALYYSVGVSLDNLPIFKTSSK